MNYHQLDLNLLRIFNVVMTELNVTRAAERLQMTQPAVSNALNRLRKILKDDLFIKVPSGVSPTLKAKEIWLPIRNSLNQIQRTLEPQDFIPMEASTVFTIAINDFIAHLILPELIPLLDMSAPGVSLRTVPSVNINVPTLLEQAKIDAAIGVFPNISERLRSSLLFASPFICVMRREHPLAGQNLTLENYIKSKHILVTLTGEPTGWIDKMLQERGLTRHIATTVNQFSLVPKLLAKSDMIVVLPTRILDICETSDQLSWIELPTELQAAPSVLTMLWHERNHQEPAQKWLRTQILTVCDAFVIT
jgi:DNA-binding transcriptional LysR family regulator